MEQRRTGHPRPSTAVPPAQKPVVRPPIVAPSPAVRAYFDAITRQKLLKESHDPKLAAIKMAIPNPTPCDHAELVTELSKHILLPPYYLGDGSLNPAWPPAHAALGRLTEQMANLTAHSLIAPEADAGPRLVHLLADLATHRALSDFDYSELGDKQSWFDVGYTLADVVVAYSVVREQGIIDTGSRAQIDSWLNALSRDHALRSDGPLPYGVNNNRYWRALHAMGTGVMTADSELQDWAADVFRQAISDMEPSGAFPAEMRRGTRALKYQNWALWPLVLTAHFAESAGLGLFAEELKGRSLRTAIEFYLTAKSSTADSPLRTAPQIETAGAEWADLAYAAYPLEALRPYLGLPRTRGDYKGGGHLSLLFYQPEP